MLPQHGKDKWKEGSNKKKHQVKKTAEGNNAENRGLMRKQETELKTWLTVLSFTICLLCSFCSLSLLPDRGQ